MANTTGCAIDLDAKKVLFGLNGDWGEATGWGVAFEGISFTGPASTHTRPPMPRVPSIFSNIYFVSSEFHFPG